MVVLNHLCDANNSMSLDKLMKLKKINKEMKKYSNMSSVGVYVWDGENDA